MPLIEGVQDFHYNVMDMKRSVAFYQEVLEMRLVSENPRRAELSCRGATVILRGTGGDPVPRVPRDSHGAHAGGTLTLRVRRIADARAHLERHLVPLLGSSDTPGELLLILEDPDGNVIKLMEPPQAARPAVVDAVLFSSPDHVSLARFYQEAFHLTPGRPFGDDHLGIKAFNTYLGFDRGAPGGAVVWFRVPDVEAAVSRCEALGARVESRPDRSCSPGEVLAVLMDPVGNRFGVIADDGAGG